MTEEELGKRDSGLRLESLGSKGSQVWDTQGL